MVSRFDLPFRSSFFFSSSRFPYLSTYTCYPSFECPWCVRGGRVRVDPLGLSSLSSLKSRSIFTDSANKFFALSSSLPDFFSLSRLALHSSFLLFYSTKPNRENTDSSRLGILRAQSTQRCLTIWPRLVNNKRTWRCLTSEYADHLRFSRSRGQQQRTATGSLGCAKVFISVFPPSICLSVSLSLFLVTDFVNSDNAR